MPGRSTPTARLPASAGAIARQVAAQLRGVTPAATPVQARGDLDGPDVHAAAAHGTSGSGGTLPFLEQIQRAFGHHDVSGVRAHIGGPAAEAAAAMGASAYASGDAVAFATTPDLHLAAHEAAHVVQQRGGVRLSGGIGRAGDEYERHADAVADAVVRGESAEALLDTHAHRGAAGGSAVQRGGNSSASTGMQLLQRVLIANPQPTVGQIVDLIRRHPHEARAIVDACRARLGADFARQVLIQPAVVALLGGSGPRRDPAPRRGGERAAEEHDSESPLDAHRHGESVEVSTEPDEHSELSVRARPSSGERAPAVEEVRIVVRDGDRDSAASVAVAHEPGEQRTEVEIEGSARTGSGAIMRGGVGGSIAPSEHGGTDARGEAHARIEVPLDDQQILWGHGEGVLTSDGHLRLDLGIDVLAGRIREMPISGDTRRQLEVVLGLDIDTRGQRGVEGHAGVRGRF